MRCTDYCVKPNKMPDKIVLRWNTCCKDSENILDSKIPSARKGLTCVPLMGHTWATLEYATTFHMVPMWFFCLSKDPHGTPWNPCMFAIYIAHVGTICDYHYGPHMGCHYGHTGVCNNFPCEAHVSCLSKYPYGTHINPRVYCPCWAHVRLPIVGPIWAATNGAH